PRLRDFPLQARIGLQLESILGLAAAMEDVETASDVKDLLSSQRGADLRYGIALHLAEERDWVSTTDLMNSTGKPRQHVHLALQRMREAGLIETSKENQTSFHRL